MIDESKAGTRAALMFALAAAFLAIASSALAADNHGLRGAPLTVGPDANCQFGTIGDAIVASSDGDRIRVMSGVYDEQVSIVSRDLELIGGFPDCVSSTPTGRSTINRQGSGLGVDIFYPSSGNDPLREVILENWLITNGGGVGNFVGGVLVEGQPGRLAVQLNNVEISNNTKTGTLDNGAGLRVRVNADAFNPGVSFGPLMEIDNDSAIVGNSTGNRGGGIYCESQFDTGTRSIIRLGSVLVFNNEAESGGGIAVNGCKSVNMYSGGPQVLIFPTGGIIGNTATLNGGGIYVEGGGEVRVQGRALSFIGDPDEAGLISGNTAEGGGAAAVTGENSRLELDDTYVVGNSATVFGGAFRVTNDATLEINRLGNTGPCQEAVAGGGVLSRPPCSIIENNSADVAGGVVSASGSSNVFIERSIIRNNEAQSGAIAEVANLTIDPGLPSLLRMRSTLLHGNSGGSNLVAGFNGTVDLRYSTVVDNFGAVGVAQSSTGGEARIEVTGSILDGNSTMFVSNGAGLTEVIGDCIISDVSLVDSGFDSAQFYSAVDPEFVDRGNDDFHLGPQSPALDYCDNSGAPLRGIDGIQRGDPWNGPPRPVAPGAVPGSFDLGAYVGVFEPLTADLTMHVDSAGFVGGGQSTIELNVTVTNQGPETAFGDHSVLDDLVVPAFSNRAWACVVPSGSSCSPSTGSGQIIADVGNLETGQSAVFTVIGTLADPDSDQSFSYGASASESGFTDDPNLSNNDDDVQIQVGLFADGFESPP